MTVDQTLEWAGEDPEKIQAAYDYELAQPNPRSTLVSQLEAKGAHS